MLVGSFETRPDGLMCPKCHEINRAGAPMIYVLPMQRDRHQAHCTVCSHTWWVDP